MRHPGPGKLLAAFRQAVTATGCGNCPARPRLPGSQRCFGVCKIRSADATTTGKRSASSRFRALGAPIASRGARQLPLITRGIGRRRETRHSVAPRIHALSVHRVVRQPVLRSGVLPADLLHNGRVVVWLPPSLIAWALRPDAYVQRYGRAALNELPFTAGLVAVALIALASGHVWRSYAASALGPAPLTIFE